MGAIKVTPTNSYMCGLYTNDGLNRLTDCDRGDLNGTFSGISTLSFAQEWSLKALGNWTSFKEDANGNGTFTDATATDLTQTRSHNKANEISSISETVGPAWTDPVQDAVGNVTSFPKLSSPATALTGKYDAWNRLTEVKDGSTLLAAYSYDGLGRRIIKKTYDSGGSLVETRQFYYSNEWQVLEERVDGRTNPQERQYVWGTQYVDELILRDRDANGGSSGDGVLEQRHYALQDTNYSVTCIVDSSGDAAERYVYAPYGTRDIRSADFSSSLSSSAVGWNIGHQGLMHDTNTSLVYNRARMLHPGLGRFMQRDPMGYADGAHLYQYLRSNSLSWADFSGLSAECEKERKDCIAKVRAQYRFGGPGGPPGLAASLKGCLEQFQACENNVGGCRLFINSGVLHQNVCVGDRSRRDVRCFSFGAEYIWNPYRGIVYELPYDRSIPLETEECDVALTKEQCEQVEDWLDKMASGPTKMYYGVTENCRTWSQERCKQVKDWLATGKL